MAELDILLQQNGACSSELMSAFMQAGPQVYHVNNRNENQNNNQTTDNSYNMTTNTQMTNSNTTNQTSSLTRNPTLDRTDIIETKLDNMKISPKNLNDNEKRTNTTTTSATLTDLNNPKLNNNNFTSPNNGASPMSQVTPEMMSMMPDMMTMMKDMDPNKMMGMMGKMPSMPKPEMMKGMMQQADDNANEIDVERILEKVKQVPSQLRQTLIDHVIDVISKAHLETVTPTHKKVAEANDRFARKMKEGPMPDMSKMPPMDPSMMWKKMVGNMVYEVTQAVRFCKKLPGFSEIHAEDQVALVKKGSFNILLNRMCLLIDHERQTMFDPNMEMKIPKEKAVNMPMGFMVMEFFNVASQMNPLRLTDEEIGIFSATILLTPDDSLVNSSAVEKLHNLFLQSLFYEMKKNHNDHENKFARLLGVIPVFQAINQKHTMVLNAMKRKQDPVMNEYPSLPQEIYSTK